MPEPYENFSVSTQLLASDLKVSSTLKIPIALVPGAAPGSICMEPDGSKLWVRKPDSSIGQVAIV